MNDRRGKPPLTEKISPFLGAVTCSGSTAITVLPEITHQVVPVPVPPAGKSLTKATSRKNHSLLKDSLFILKRGEITHVISEDYSYKTNAYYTILQREMEGITVKPSSGAVIDAFVVPICLERAHLAGIPVCAWEISQAYVPLPAILYGINYFASTTDFFIARDSEGAKVAVGHITNKGKYPFCYQELGTDAEIFPCTVIFGKTIGCCAAVADMAGKLYDLFAIPLMQMMLVRNGDDYTLSSLSHARYTHMTDDERQLLEAHLAGQEFL